MTRNSNARESKKDMLPKPNIWDYELLPPHTTFLGDIGDNVASSSRGKPWLFFIRMRFTPCLTNKVI